LHIPEKAQTRIFRGLIELVRAVLVVRCTELRDEC